MRKEFKLSHEAIILGSAMHKTPLCSSRWSSFQNTFFLDYPIFYLFMGLSHVHVKQPVKPDGQVNVTLSISVSTANFDEDTRTLSGIIWMNLAWKDER